MTPISSGDNRTPSPPFGYSQPCNYDEERQLHLVAEFHAHRIKPGRIAYRTGIDIAFVKALIAGQSHKKEFNKLLAYYRKNRRQQRLNEAASTLKGTARFELENRIEAEYQTPAPRTGYRQSKR